MDTEDDLTYFCHLGFQPFFEDGMLFCPECGGELERVEIEDYICSGCGEQFVWGG